MHMQFMFADSATPCFLISMGLCLIGGGGGVMGGGVMSTVAVLFAQL